MIGAGADFEKAAEHERAGVSTEHVRLDMRIIQPDTDIDFKDIVRRSDTMLYRQKRRKKVGTDSRVGQSRSPVWSKQS